MRTVTWERGVRRVFHGIAAVVVAPGLVSIAAAAVSRSGDVIAYAAFMAALYTLPALAVLYAVMFLVLWIGRGFDARAADPPPRP